MERLIRNPISRNELWRSFGALNLGKDERGRNEGRDGGGGRISGGGGVTTIEVVRLNITECYN